MIIGIGADIIKIQRIKSLLDQKGNPFKNKIFTQKEQEQGDQLSSTQQPNFYAKRFAAKEAVAKALGTGIGTHAEWKDIEVISQKNGAPTIQLSGKALQTAQSLAIQKGRDSHKPTTKSSNIHIHVSLSDDTFAQAFVIIELI